MARSIGLPGQLLAIVALRSPGALIDGGVRGVGSAPVASCSEFVPRVPSIRTDGTNAAHGA